MYITGHWLCLCQTQCIDNMQLCNYIWTPSSTICVNVSWCIQYLNQDWILPLVSILENSSLTYSLFFLGPPVNNFDKSISNCMVQKHLAMETQSKRLNWSQMYSSLAWHHTVLPYACARYLRLFQWHNMKLLAMTLHARLDWVNICTDKGSQKNLCVPRFSAF